MNPAAAELELLNCRGCGGPLTYSRASQPLPGVSTWLAHCVERCGVTSVHVEVRWLGVER